MIVDAINLSFHRFFCRNRLCSWDRTAGLRLSVIIRHDKRRHNLNFHSPYVRHVKSETYYFVCITLRILVELPHMDFKRIFETYSLITCESLSFKFRFLYRILNLFICQNTTYRHPP